jgi:hypothetical protein
MTDETAFRQFYNRELQPLLAQTETSRKQVQQFSYMMYGAFAVAAIIALALFRSGSAGPAMIIPFILPAVTGWIYADKKKKFTQHFKQTIISRIVQFINPGCQYQPQGFVSEHEYEASSLYRRDHDRYNGEDYFEGLYNKTRFFCSELHTQYKTSNGKGQTSWHTIFKGLFFVADFNKHFQGRTYVWDNGNAEASTGFFGRLFSSFSQSVEKVNLESPEFENEFDVFSTSQTESRYILSPSLMVRMVNLKQKMGCEMRCSFINTKMYITFALRENLFEPGINRPNENFETAWMYVVQFGLFFEIIDELNLNTRIWTKE